MVVSSSASRCSRAAVMLMIVSIVSKKNRQLVAGGSRGFGRMRPGLHPSASGRGSRKSKSNGRRASSAPIQAESGAAGKPARAVPSPEHDLRAAKQREAPALRLVADDRVPDLGGAAEVDGGRLAGERALEQRPEEVRLQLDRGEALRALGQVRDAAEAAQRV